MELVLAASRPKSRSNIKRGSNRRPVVVQGRLSWKDQRGTNRIANVTTRNVSNEGVYIEWREPSAIPLYRLVQFQVNAEARSDVNLPEALRTGKVLSAVVRVGERRPTTGSPEGYALRLLVEPHRAAVHAPELVGAIA